MQHDFEDDGNQQGIRSAKPGRKARESQSGQASLCPDRRTLLPRPGQAGRWKSPERQSDKKAPPKTVGSATAPDSSAAKLLRAMPARSVRSRTGFSVTAGDASRLALIVGDQKEWDSLSEEMRRPPRSIYVSSSSQFSVLQNHLRDGFGGGVGKRERYMDGSQFGGELRSFAVERKGGSASGLAAHFDVPPADTMVPACAERFHGSLFSCKAGRVAFNAVGLGLAILNLTLSEDPAQKAVAITLESPGQCAEPRRCRCPYRRSWVSIPPP